VAIHIQHSTPIGVGTGKLFHDHSLALLTEKGGRDFNLVSDYYKERNSIADGGSFINPISMPTVIIELKRLYSVLKT
jgi:hypothetical protein